MPLRRRLALLAVGYIVLMSLAGVAALMLGTSRTSAARLDSALTVISERTLQLRASYVDMESAERGFVIGGDDVFLEPYTSGAASIERLQPLIRNQLQQANSGAVNRFDALVKAGDAWRTQAAIEVQARRTRGREAAEGIVKSQRGKARFDGLRLATQAFTLQLDSERAVAATHRDRRARQLTQLVVLSPLMSGVFTLLAALLVNRWVVHPIRAMVRAVRGVVGGDLSMVVPAVGATDVAELGASVDSMRSTIAEKLAEATAAQDLATRSREALEQSTTVVLQLRTELASELGTFPDGWSAAADLLPAEGYVAGDCYDVTLVSPHQLGIIVIDIAGHGAAQAIAALKSKEILRAALRVAMAPGDALALLAEQMGDMEGSFLTAFVALVDTRTGHMQFANAGHPPALVSHDNEVLRELEPTGPLLGAFSASWRTSEVTIKPGGKLAVYTDGLSEARDHAQLYYGMERLAHLVSTLPCEQAESVLKACFDDLHSFSPHRLTDDVTMVLVCRACEHDDSGLTAAIGGVETAP